MIKAETVSETKVYSILTQLSQKSFFKLILHLIQNSVTRVHVRVRAHIHTHTHKISKHKCMNKRLPFMLSSILKLHNNSFISCNHILFCSAAFFIPFTEISLHATHEESDVMNVEGLLASVQSVVNCNIVSHQSSPSGISSSPAMAQTSVVSHSSSVLGPSGATSVGSPQMSGVSCLEPRHALQGVLNNNKDITNNIVISNSNVINSERKQDVHMASPESSECIVSKTAEIPSVTGSSKHIHVTHTMVTNEESLPSLPATPIEIFDGSDKRVLESGKQVADILRILSASGQIQGIQLTASVVNETNPSSTNIFEASGVRAAEILSFLSASGQIQDIQLASSLETGNASDLSETMSKTSGNVLYLTSPSLNNVNLSNDLTPFINSPSIDSNQSENTPNVTEMRNSRIVLHVQDAPVILDPDKNEEVLEDPVSLVSPSILMPSKTPPGSSELSSPWVSAVNSSLSSQCAGEILPAGKHYEERNWSSSPDNVRLLQQSDLNLVTPSSQVLFTVLSTNDSHSYDKEERMTNVLQDITKDAGICKCSPCSCDPTQNECEKCNSETEQEKVSDAPEVPSSNQNTTQRKKNDLPHEKEVGTLQVNTNSSDNILCTSVEIGNNHSDVSSYKRQTTAVRSSTDGDPAAHDIMSTEVRSSHYDAGDTESFSSAPANYNSTNMVNWQNPGCSVDTLIVPHILPPNEMQNHREAENSENNNVKMDSSRLSGSCECCGKNSKTSHFEAEGNNNGTNGREPCCVVVCLKTLEQLKNIIDRGCCSGAENSLRALALQISSVKSSCCSGKH